MSLRITSVLIVAIILVMGCSSAGGTPSPASVTSAAPPSAVSSVAPAATSTPASAATAAASAAPQGSVAGKKVAFVLWGMDGYQLGQGAHFKKAAEADGVSVTIVDGKADPLAQAKAIDDLIAGKIDGIAWQPVDEAAAVEPAKAIMAAKIPLVFVGAAPDRKTGVVAPYLPFNDYAIAKKAGSDAATWIKQNWPGKVPRMVLFDLIGLQMCEWRLGGFKDGVMSVTPDSVVVFDDTVPELKDKSMAKMEDQLQANPDFNVFAGCGGDLTLGGIAGLQGAGRAKAVNKVPQTEWILTIDGTPAEIALLTDPNSAVMETISMTPKENGIKAWDTLKQVMLGQVARDSDIQVDLPGVILPTECQQAATIYEAEYGITDIYQPIDCTK
jgi:ABC-type sugar transport system substrate-binding protein